MSVGLQDCTSFTVSKGESISDVIERKNLLPAGKCKVICVDSKDANRIVYAKANGDAWRITGTSGQNIYTYFKNIDTAKGNKPRWQIIQEEMEERGIKEITVTVCEIKESGGKSPETAGAVVSVPPPITPKSASNAEQLPVSKGKEKVLIVISCSAKKKPGGGPMLTGLTFMDNIAQVPTLIANRNLNLLQHPPFNNGALMPAWDRYDGHLYRLLKSPANQALISQLEQKGCVDFVIISALYGVVNKNTPIADYNLVMQPGHGILWGNSIADSINKYYQANGFTKLVCFLPNTYYNVTRGNYFLLAHQRQWPQGLRGIPNIYNRVAGMIMTLLQQVALNCKSSD